MKKLIIYLTVAVVLCSQTLGLAADRYQQVLLKGPNHAQTVNISAGTVAYLFGTIAIPSGANPGIDSGSVVVSYTVEGVSISEIGHGFAGGFKTLILAGPATVDLTTAANTHAEIAFLWTILTRPNPNISGIKQ